MASVLLVHDDIAAIAPLRRLLTGAGHEVLLATSAADALIAFGHHLPALVIVSPGIEGGRGNVVLEELGQHPEHRRLRVLLLGGEVPGFEVPVIPLAFDGKVLLGAVEEAIRRPEPGEELERGENETFDDDAAQTYEQSEPVLEPMGELHRIGIEPSAGGRQAAAGIHLPQGGTASLEELARLAVRVAEVRGAIRLDLRAEGAVRTLWFESGRLVAADSTVPHESLPDRARRDGLIDSRQHWELRLMRAMSTAALLQLLLDRGYIREQEAAPLVQRHAEQIALEGLSEARSHYQLLAESPGPGVAVGANTRPLTGMVVEALRRSLDGPERMAMLGGLAAIPSITPGAEQYVYGLHLGEREDRFLQSIDGETTVEGILLAVGIHQGAALKLVAALAALGWLDLTAPQVEAPPPPPPTLDLERLDAKFHEVQEADYFAILGLSRAAGGEEVQRAYAQLSAEFDPVKYAGHPDGNVHHRARQVQEALSEAAHVLRDDRLRASYSRHLVD